MNKSSKKVERGSRKVTEFFPRRSSALSSSQPPSSQPPSSPAQMTAPKLGATQRQAAASTEIPLKHEEEIIILSSDSGPITVSSASSHISISSDTHSVILVTDSSGPKENFAKRVIAKDSTPARQVMKSSVNAPAPTGAQTRVKRRTAAPVDPPLLTLPKAIPPRKRKLQWESSSDEGPAIPNPDKMKPSLACAPASRATLHSVSLPLAPMENTPSTPSKRYESGPSTPSKRARLSLREPPGLSNTSGNDADIEEIPSSQSDEHELTIPKTAKKDPTEVKERVDQWRRESSVVVSPNIRATSSLSEVAPLGSTLSSPLSSALDIPYDSTEGSVLSSFPGIHDHMDVDEDMHQSPISPDLLVVENATGARTPKSEAEVSQQLYIRSSTSAFSSGSLSHRISPVTSPQPHSQMQHPAEISPLDSITDALRPSTPPPMVALPELRATPVALDPKTKAEEMIAQIKAAAYAAVQSSPEEVPLDFNILDVVSSSEDEDSDFHLTRKSPAVRMPSSSRSSSPLSDVDSPIPPQAGPSRAYNLRRRSSPSNVPVTSGLISTRLNSAPSGHQRKPKKSRNPLASLLKDMQRADQRGNGIEGLRAAEAAMQAEKARSKGKMREEMDHEDAPGNYTSLADYRINPLTDQEALSDSELSGNSEDEDDEIAAGEVARILGDREGQEVERILADDKKGRDAKQREVIKGIPLWVSTEASDAMDCENAENSLSTFPYRDVKVESDPALVCLQTAVASKDVARLSRFLTPELISRTKPQNIDALVYWLFELAMSPSSHTLDSRATEALIALARRGTPTSSLSSALLHTLLRFGAKADVLEASGLEISEHVPFENVKLDTRHTLLKRAVFIVKTFAEHRTITVEDMPSIFCPMLSIALDPSSPPELRIEVLITIDTVGTQIPSTSGGISEIEFEICSRIGKFSKGFSPTNKAFMMSSFRGGSIQMARISRRIAHNLLLNLDNSAPSHHALPPLLPIIKLLSSPAGSGSLFDITGNSDKPDYYDELGCHVDILNLALNDVDAYVVEEKSKEQTLQVSRPPSPTKAKSQETELQQIKSFLQELHGKIVDTRAAHLDRSRVKAALQQMAFRVHYGRDAALSRLRGPAKPRNIHGYFRLT